MTFATGLRSWWGLEGLTDYGPAGNSLSNVGSATFVAGKKGNALHTEGNAQYLEGSQTIDLRNIDFTIAAWIRMGNAAVGNPQAAFNLGAFPDTGGPNISLQVYVIGGPKMRANFVVSDTGGWGSGAWIDLASSDTNWHFLVAVFDVATRTPTLYVDNTAYLGAAQNNFNPSLLPVSTPKLGRRYDASNISEFDEVAWWNRKLSADEIATLWNAGSGTSYGDIFSRIVNATGPMTFLPLVMVDPSAGQILRGSTTMLKARERSFSLHTRNR